MLRLTGKPPVAILAAIIREREAQDQKWGTQDHPSVRERDGVRCIVDSNLARDICNAAANEGVIAWEDIAIEELAEALDAPDEGSRREELVQLAAVVIAWIECIDRRAARTTLVEVTT